jgi:origin recognition complex subunit 5
LSPNPPSIFQTPPAEQYEYTAELAAEDDAWLWQRYLGVLWDTIAKDAARDLVSFRRVARELWRPFVRPIENGTVGTRDFARLINANRALLQSEGVLVDRIVHSEEENDKTNDAKREAHKHELSYYQKYLLCAAYLASYTPARQDATFFMKSTEKRKRRRGGAVASSRTPKHRKVSGTIQIGASLLRS